jgi:mRNA-degrading endonuclease RelE of RelBE toxin-antitoxin system
MHIQQQPFFRKSYKKLHPNQLKDVDAAIDTIIANPTIGTLKKGDLKGFRVYKFNMVNQLTLIAYTFEEDALILIFIAIGPHENFYRSLKIKM